MINAWLDLPVIGIFASLTILYGATAACMAWLTFRSPLRARIQAFTGIVAPYFASIALLFALLTGFLAGDVIDRFKSAVRAVQTEASALSSLNALTLATSVDARPTRAALIAYLDALVRDEWPSMTRAESSPRADLALTGLLRAAADSKMRSPTSNAVHIGLIELGLQAAIARSERLALNSRQADEIKWVTVLLLGIMTQLAIAMVHLEHARAHIAAQVVFTAGAIIALGMIAVQEAPFDGALRIPPAPLERVLHELAT